MNIHMRADGGQNIGLGHVRRALVLARLFEREGAAVTFGVPSEVSEYLISEGVQRSSILPAQEAPKHVDHIVTDINWSGNSAAASREIEALARGPATVTVIDSMPPDHFMTRGEFQPDLLITPYHNGKSLRPSAKVKQWIAGADVAVLDPGIAHQKDIRRSDPPRVLISCGGSDPEGLTLRIAQEMAQTQWPTDVVIGPLFKPDLVAALHEISARNITLHVAPKGLSQLIARSSLVIGRVGLLRYEVAVLGRRGIYLHYGPEYLEYLQEFAGAGIAEIHFAKDQSDEANFLKRIGALGPSDFSPNLAASTAVDGLGAFRVVKTVMDLKK